MGGDDGTKGWRGDYIGEGGINRRKLPIGVDDLNVDDARLLAWASRPNLGVTKN